MTEPSFKAMLEGPFFTRNPGATVLGNIRHMLYEVGKLAASEVRRAIESHRGEMPRWTGWSARHVTSRTRGALDNRLQAFVFLDTEGMTREDAIRTKAAGAGRTQGMRGTTPGIEGRWHPFRKTKNTIVRSRAVIGANLTKGIE